MNLKIVKAYLLKELFKKLWDYKRRGWAAKYLIRQRRTRGLLIVE